MGRAERLHSTVREIAARVESVGTEARRLELDRVMPDIDAIDAATRSLKEALHEFVQVTSAVRSNLAERRRVRHALRNAVHGTLGHTEALLDDLATFDAATLRAPLDALRAEIIAFWDAVDEGGTI